MKTSGKFFLASCLISSSLFSMSPEVGTIVAQNLAPYRTQFKNHALTPQDVTEMYTKATSPVTTPHVSFYLLSMLADYSLQEKNVKPASFLIYRASIYYNVLKNYDILTETDEKNFSKLRDEIGKMYLSDTNQIAVSIDNDIKDEEESNNEIFIGLDFNSQNLENFFNF